MADSQQLQVEQDELLGSMPVPSSGLRLGQPSPVISEEVLQPLCTLLALVQRMALGHAGP